MAAAYPLTSCTPSGCNASQAECLGMCMATPQPKTMQRCNVVIKMPDGSRGEHTGLYPHSLDAYDRAVELFPDAQVVVVTVFRGRRAAA